MVQITVTPRIFEGLKCLREEERRTTSTAAGEEHPVRSDLEIGNPIAHGEVVGIWRDLKRQGHREFSLEALLHGSKVYVPPPTPNPEPTPQFKALMARLRREEEERSYQRMIKQPSRMEGFSQQFPYALHTSQAAFAEVNRPVGKADEGDNDVTYADVHRQLMLILNFLLSIFGVAATIWVAARWWPTPSRLFVTLGGAIAVAIAEVGVYSGYIWRLGEAKKEQEARKEVREVVKTWVVSQEEEESTNDGPVESHSPAEGKPPDEDSGVRRRFKGATR